MAIRQRFLSYGRTPGATSEEPSTKALPAKAPTDDGLEQLQRYIDEQLAMVLAWEPLIGVVAPDEWR